MEDYIGEIVVGLILIIFGFAFRGWATAIKDSTSTILQSLEKLAKEFHEHVIKTENRVTKVETKMDRLERDCDDD